MHHPDAIRPTCPMGRNVSTSLLLRTLGETSAFASRHDDRMWLCLCNLLEFSPASVPESSRMAATLPSRFGGLGTDRKKKFACAAAQKTNKSHAVCKSSTKLIRSNKTLCLSANFELILDEIVVSLRSGSRNNWRVALLLGARGSLSRACRAAESSPN